MKALSLFAGFALLLMPVLPCSAAESPAAAGEEKNMLPVVLERSLNCAFVPVRAFFFVLTPGLYRKLPAQVMLPPQADNGGERWHFGVGLTVPRGLGTIRHALLVEGEGGALAFAPPRPLRLNDGSRFRSSDEIREHLQQRKKVLESWDVQQRVQFESLERLRSDAEVIGNLGRIAEKAEELQRVRSEINDLEKDLESLKRFIKLASKALPPHNFVRRRLSLTQQLEELVRVAGAMEASERQRKAGGEAKLQQELSLVEATRDDDYDALRVQLSSLRKQRVELEEKYMGAAGTNDEYQVP